MRQIARCIAALVSLLAFAAPPVGAQANPVFAPGARLRLITPRLDASQQTVTVISATSDSIVFRSETNPALRTIPLSDISAVEVRSHGERPFLRNMLIGSAVGAGTGALMASVAYKECEDCWFSTSRSAETAGGALVGSIAGLLGGLAVAAFQRGERWTRIPLNATVALQPSPGGRFALTLTRAF
jgi:hypothetical protein